MTPHAFGTAEATEPTNLPALALEPVANICASGSCPTIFKGDDGTLVVQGFIVSPERVDREVPAGEMLVQIPRELLTEALRNLS